MTAHNWRGHERRYRRRHLNPHHAADRAQPGPGGYPMLEVYLNELAGK